MPFSYVVDMFVYRMLWRRYEKTHGPARRAGPAQPVAWAFSWPR